MRIVPQLAGLILAFLSFSQTVRAQGADQPPPPPEEGRGAEQPPGEDPAAVDAQPATPSPGAPMPPTATGAPMPRPFPMTAQPPPMPPPPMPPPLPHEPDDPNLGRDGYPLAGYHGGLFYLRDRDDNFRFFLRTRLHIDSYNYFGPGVSDTALKSTVLLRRVRTELGGELYGHWQWEAQFEFGPTAFSNPNGTEESSAAKAGTDPTASTARYAAVQEVGYRGRPVHAYVNYRAADELNVQVGQFNLPFTAENRTSTNQITFMERALPSRAWGAPYTKDMGVRAWGYLDKHVLDYSLAVVQGEGENRPNADNRALAAMRVYTRPLALGGGPLEKLQIGASFKYGMHDKNYVAYDYPAMSTQSGYKFWNPTYTDSVSGGRLVHVIPSGAELGLAGELRVPFHRFDLRGEFVYLKNDTREAVDGFQVSNTERFGTLKGYAYYVMLSTWLLGKPGVNGDPGDRQPPRLKLDKPDPTDPPHGLELAVKWEQLNASYEGAARSGTADPKNMDGDIKINVLSSGVNYWASKHLRFSVNYMFNMFPDSAPTKASSSDGPKWSPTQRALAPANRLAVGINDDARDNAHTLHEVTARVAVAF